MADPRIGIDVGGTKVAAALVDETGTVRARASAPTPRTGSTDLLAAMADAARGVDPGGTAAAAGVGTGGVVDAGSGTVVSATDLLPGWAGTPVGALLAERLGMPVAVDNDVNALAAGELRFGALADSGSALFAAVGTGIGGAVVVGGRLRRGPHHTAGALGHLPVGGGRRCSCGRTGHLESEACGPAIAAAYRQRTGAAAADVPEVARRAEDGDPAARAVIDHAARTLGTALAGAAHLLDPDAVVLGGGVARLGDPYWTALRAAFREELLPPLRGVPVRPAALGADASVVGAAALAFGPAAPPGAPGAAPAGPAATDTDTDTDTTSTTSTTRRTR